MINAIILNSNSFLEETTLVNKISTVYPQLNLVHLTYSNDLTFYKIEKYKPHIIFFEIDHFNSSSSETIQKILAQGFETILVTPKKDSIYEAIQYNLSGYLLKPLEINTFKIAVDKVLKRVRLKNNNEVYNPIPISNNQVIGIPTMEGYEFLVVQDIIRCESYLKCTRVITINRSNTISSYNIGEFVKQLKQYGFFAPHQSHLINLGKVKKYLKNGNIIMHDDSVVPIARRRRSEFLEKIPKI